jgi:hypothetical protein
MKTLNGFAVMNMHVLKGKHKEVFVDELQKWKGYSSS